MQEAKRIVILTADTGLGHKSAANAIAAALEERYGERCRVQITNPMNHEKCPDIIRNTHSSYDESVEHPLFYRATYAIGNVIPFTSVAVEKALGVMMAELMCAVLSEEQPDVVITVHHDYLPALDAAFASSQTPLPVMTVVTDLTKIHRRWFHEVSTCTVVPTETAYHLALKHNVPPEKVKMIGIPVHPAFAKQYRTKEDIRRQLGWEQTLPVVLAVGSKRVSHLVESLSALDASDLPLQFALAAGGDETLWESFQSIDWRKPAYLYRFVDDMPTFLYASDCAMSKAGGLIVSEALASGLPLLLVDVIEGQETGNADYVVENGAGERAEHPREVVEIMSNWLANGGEGLAQAAANARELGRPRAAYDFADLAVSLCL
jgi:1,2-diacylglycerol 3-beta-galactosyltransferase